MATPASSEGVHRRRGSAVEGADPEGAETATNANAESAAVGSSGTVTLPSTVMTGSAVAPSAPKRACRSVRPHILPAAKRSQVAPIASADETARATPSDGSSSFITEPITQKGKGSQLVPLGS